MMIPAHQIERVAGDDLAKADERRAWLKVVGLHDPHRPAPGNVDRVVEESRHAVTRTGRVDQFDLDTLAGIEPERVGGVERRVKHGAEVFSELDWHDEDRSALGDGFGCRDRPLSVAQSIETPLALVGPAHFSIWVSTNFCRYSGGLCSPATRSPPISRIRVFTAGVLMVASVAA